MENILNYDIEYATACSEEYALSDPFPHLVIDNFVDNKIATEAYEQFPKPDTLEWIKYNNPLEKKLMFSDYNNLSPSIQKIIDGFNSAEFLTFLEKLTGFKNIIADEELIGGGLHQIERGGKLDIHADFNIHYNTGNQRCLNLILFLNKNWQEKYGGHFELWDRKMKECRSKVLPTFNRAVIFSTDATSYHGHPHPLACPKGETRKSIALYYYIENNNQTKSHSTVYKKRPTEPEDKKLDEFRKLRSIPRDKRDK